MRKIIRLTESDLIRLVKRVINEQPTPSTGIGKSAAKEFIYALSKFNDDETGAVMAIEKLRNKTDFIEFKNQIKTDTGKEICVYLNSEMSQIDLKEWNTITGIILKLSGNNLNCNDKVYSGGVFSTIKNKLAKSFQDRTGSSID